MRPMYKLVFICWILACLSCEKRLDTFISAPSVTYSSFYPVSIGHWISYQVDSIRYIKSSLDPEPIITKSSYYILEEIVDTLEGFGTPTQYQIRVSIRKSLSDPWVFLRNNSLQLLSNEITKNESNLRFSKLHSPISATISWKGNKYIDTSVNKLFADWNYRYIDLFIPRQVSSHSFDTTITVLQYLDSNVIEKTHFYEVYAKGVGMVYSENHKLEKQNLDNFWDKPENGYSIITKVVDWKR